MSDTLDFEVLWGPFNQDRTTAYYPRQYIGSVKDLVNVGRYIDFYADFDSKTGDGRAWCPFLHWIPFNGIRRACSTRSERADDNENFQKGKRLLEATWFLCFERKPFATLGKSEFVIDMFKKYI